MKKAPVALLGLLLLFALPAYAAEPAAATLTDQSIHAFYDEMNAAVLSRDAAKFSGFLQLHLAEDYSYKEHTVLTVGSDPTVHEADEEYDRAKYISTQEEMAKNAEVESYQFNISGITYSDNKNMAQVSNGGNLVATAKVPAPGGEAAHVRISGKAACDDIISLRDGVIRLHSSVCNDRSQVTPLQ